MIVGSNNLFGLDMSFGRYAANITIKTGLFINSCNGHR